MEKSMRMAMLLPCLNYFRNKADINVQALESWGISVSALSDPNARMAVKDIDVLLRLIKKELNVPQLGLLAGEKFELRNYGLLGFMLSYCSNVRELFDLASRYYSYISSSVHPTMELKDELVYVSHNITQGEIAEERTRGELFASAIYRFSQFLSNGRLRIYKIDFSFPEPEYSALYTEFFPGVEVSFDNVKMEMVFYAQDLDIKLDFPDKEMKAKIQAELDAVVGNEKARTFSERIEMLLVAKDQGFAFNLSMNEIATLLNIGPKTLSRRLANEGTKFSDLHEGIRSKYATRMLRESSLKIDDVALELGFTDRSAFERAFKRWEDTTPSQYRKQHSESR